MIDQISLTEDIDLFTVARDNKAKIKAPKRGFAREKMWLTDYTTHLLRCNHKRKTLFAICDYFYML